MRQTFSEIFSADYHGKTIRVRCIVTGKSVSPYVVPKRIGLACSTTHAEGAFCMIEKLGGIVTVEPKDENILKFLDVSSSRIKGVIAQIYRISCKSFVFQVLEVQNVERIFVQPPTGKERNKDNQPRATYFIGYGIDVNTIYDLKGYGSNDPFTQEATTVFTKAKRIKSDVETFELTSSTNKELRAFQLEEATVDKVYEHLEHLYRFYSRNITKIYGRFDLHLAVDLVTKSVMSFDFANETIYKGWVDAMVIGDGRTGKGFVSEKLLNYFGVGEIVSGDNCSFAGLIGGIEQISRHWVVTWGKIPMNDCGLVVIDEASELQESDWTRLSRVRSEGVAEITKIKAQVANARTRLLFLANPVNKTISNYSYGIQSLLEVVKGSEDISRFDYALVVSHGEVKVEDINKERTTVTPLFSGKLENDLILWAWSRKNDEVVFSDEAKETVFRLSLQLAKQYDTDNMLKLIQGENIRTKLAKLAICFAARLYSNKDKGKYLYVDTVHVECANIFLNLIYKKEPCGYYAMAQLNKALDVEGAAKHIAEVEKFFKAFKNRTELARCLLKNNNITSNDITDHMNLHRETAQEIISTLLRHNCIQKRGSFYYKTPPFTSWLKKVVLEKEEKRGYAIGV